MLLRAWFESEDLTQAQTAKRLGFAQPRVSEIVRGKIELLSLDYLVGLCAKVGIAVVYEWQFNINYNKNK